MRILTNQLQPAVIRIAPEGVRVSERELLHGTIVIQRRTGIPIPDELSVRIDSAAPIGVCASVVCVEKIVGIDLILKSADG